MLATTTTLSTNASYNDNSNSNFLSNKDQLCEMHTSETMQTVVETLDKASLVDAENPAVPDNCRSSMNSSTTTSTLTASTTSLTPTTTPTTTTTTTPSITTPKTPSTVRFAAQAAVVVGTIPTRESLSEEEIKETWWSNTEYHGIRLGAKFITKDVRKRDKNLIAGIEEAYARALHLACTLSDDDYEQLMDNCQSQAVCMLEWCERKISARGLERYTSHKHRFERTEFAEETRAAVLRLAGNETVSADQLSVFYKEYARSAAIYARFCGQADALVTRSAAARTSRGCTSEAEQQPPVPRPTLTSKQPSRGRMMVRELSQRIETAV